MDNTIPSHGVEEWKKALELYHKQGILLVNYKSNTMNVSFDFDNTLDDPAMQTLAKKFIKLDADVFVVTSRGTEMHGGMELNNDDLFEVTDRIGIKRENIIFTGYKDKHPFLKDMDFQT